MSKIGDAIYKLNYPAKDRWLDEFDKSIQTDEPDIIMITARECIDSNRISGFIDGTIFMLGVYFIGSGIARVVKKIKAKKKETKEE